jgi:maleate cis-trans isomerase
MNANELKVLENSLAVIETLQAEIEKLKLKTLTNEEISDIRDEFFAPDGCNIYTFARALLKKANEI